jgi:hypothetical protein
MQGASAALVDSMLDKGDEIISPQYCNTLIFSEGNTFLQGFLNMPGSKHEWQLKVIICSEVTGRYAAVSSLRDGVTINILIRIWPVKGIK